MRAGGFYQREAKAAKAKAENEIIEIAVPPLIETAVFDKAQASLKARNPRVLPPRVVTGSIVLTTHLADRLFGPNRLEKRAAGDDEVKNRADSLQSEIARAEDKLKRLYRMVEDGVTGAVHLAAHPHPAKGQR